MPSGCLAAAQKVVIANADAHDDGEKVRSSEGTELFVERTPPRLCGKPLSESEIRVTTGLNVVAIREGDRLIPNPLPSHVLTEGSELVMIGSAAQRLDFLGLDESA